MILSSCRPLPAVGESSNIIVSYFSIRDYLVITLLEDDQLISTVTNRLIRKQFQVITDCVFL